MNQREPIRTETSLEVEGIHHRFSPAAPWILDDVGIKVKEGDFVAMVGASGSGKTTMLRIMAGLIEPTRGSVRVAGNDVTGHPDATRSMVFQADRLFPWRTAQANVAFGLEIQGHDKVSRNRAALESLRMVGLRGHEGTYPSELSGGMRQRVNLARALVLKPRFLLMDEPFAALDAQTREMMQKELLDILDSTSAGVVFVTHQIEEALYLSDRVIVLGGQPARIRATITSPFPRPRDLSTKRSPEFQKLHDEIWHEIEDDVKRAAVPSDPSAESDLPS